MGAGSPVEDEGTPGPPLSAAYQGLPGLRFPSHQQQAIVVTHICDQFWL